MDASEALHIKLEELQNFLDYTYAEAIKHSGGMCYILSTTYKLSTN